MVPDCSHSSFQPSNRSQKTCSMLQEPRKHLPNERALSQKIQHIKQILHASRPLGFATWRQNARRSRDGQWQVYRYGMRGRVDTHTLNCWPNLLIMCISMYRLIAIKWLFESQRPDIAEGITVTFGVSLVLWAYSHLLSRYASSLSSARRNLILR